MIERVENFCSVEENLLGVNLALAFMELIFFNKEVCDKEVYGVLVDQRRYPIQPGLYGGKKFGLT